MSRVTKRTVKCLDSNTVLSEERFTYDAAGNITDAPNSCFQYDTNNRLVVFNGNAVSYDLDGNMLNNGEQCFTYDSANRLITADGHTYTYNAEDVRIRNLCACCEDTTYTYDTNAKLSKLLCKTTNGVTTKYVYGNGLIGEAVGSTFKTYHFDSRGSTIAITDACGNITDAFVYDTYGKMIDHCGNSTVIFGYNGRDGVVTDDNGLIYMRARYYSPDMRRFINADIVAGEISNAITLNRFAYANGNPVSFVDPFGLSAERGVQPTTLEAAYMAKHIYDATTAMYNIDLNTGDYQGINNWKLENIKFNTEGMKIGVYYYENDSGIKSYTLASAGSSTEIFTDFDGAWDDWINNNFTQPFGNSLDMKDSIAFANEFVKEHPNAQITFVGHSKGGAEAAANAVATKKDCIIFNPATVFLSEYGLSSDNYSANMTAYIVEGEFLNNIFGAISAPIDEVHYLKEPTWTSIIKSLLGSPAFWIADSFNKHSMDTVIDLLEEE